jgi:hypothetical protein
MRPLQDSCLQRMAHKTKKSGKKKKKKALQPSPPQAVWQEGQAPFPTKPRMPSSNTRIGYQKNKSRTFTKPTELSVVTIPVFFLSSLLTLPSLFSYFYSYPLHFPSFSCATVHYSPSQLLFLLILIHSPHFHLPFYSSSNCSPTMAPSYTFTTHWLAYCTNHTHSL